MKDKNLHRVLLKADILSPWTVGRYHNKKTIQRYIKETALKDKKLLEEKKKDFMPVIFPGFSWKNLKKTKGLDVKLNQIPRLKGKFLWEQASLHVSNKVKMIYIAMFDEIDEGTAIFKCANKVPVGKSSFMTYEGLSSDHYLWLSGMIKKMLVKKKPRDMPKR